jgi:hypothetical protein
MSLKVLTFATMNSKSAPMTHNAGNENAQYESPFRCTAARTKAATYEQAPMPMMRLLDTLCWINAAMAFASSPTTTMGSMCTPVIRALYPSSVWKYSAIQKENTGKPRKPNDKMRRSYTSQRKLLQVGVLQGYSPERSLCP